MIFPWRVPLVFQAAPGTGKSYRHAENVKTSGIGPSRNRSWPFFLIPFRFVVLAKKNRPGVRSDTPQGSEG